MRFKYYDNLRLFTVVARHLSFTASAEELHLTKGAVSYQIARLEEELGFPVFERRARGISLTEKGKKLRQASGAAFGDIEAEITRLRRDDGGTITIGMSTYFASRWLSPRLMNFTSQHPGISLRLQPTIGVFDLQSECIDLAIRWGRGDWRDMYIEPLFVCPAMPTAGAEIAEQVGVDGLQTVLDRTTLLHDFEGSKAWEHWHNVAGLSYKSSRDDLVIPDPNVRVQAVIDGQGVALNDHLIDVDIASGKLFRISDVELDDYGYFLAYPKSALSNSALSAFRDWIIGEAG